MINSLFRSLLMQGAGEEPASSWKYADYVHSPNGTGTGIPLKINSFAYITIEFDCTNVSFDSMQPLFYINDNNKIMFNRNNITVYINGSATNFGIWLANNEAHRIYLTPNGIYVDNLALNSITLSSFFGSMYVGGTSTSSIQNLKIYNLWVHIDGNNLTLHDHDVCYLQCYKASGIEWLTGSGFNELAINVGDVNKTGYVGNYDYEPEYVDYIEPTTYATMPYYIEGITTNNRDNVKIKAKFSNPYYGKTSTGSEEYFWASGYPEYEDETDWYQNYAKFSSTAGDITITRHNKKFSSSITKSTTFTDKFIEFNLWDDNNLAASQYVNNKSLTNNGSNALLDNSDEDYYHFSIFGNHVDGATGLFYNKGIKLYYIDIQVNNGRIYKLKPVKRHYTCAFNQKDEGYLFDELTGKRFMYKCMGQHIYMKTPSIFEQKYIAAKNNAASIPTDIYTNSNTLLTRAQFNLGVVNTQDRRYYHNLLTMANYASPGGLACIGFKSNAKNYFMFYVNGSGKDEWTTVTQNTWNTISTSSYSNYCYSDAIPITFFGSNYGSQANNQSCLYNYINEAKLTIGGVVYDCKFGVLGDVVGVMINDVFYPANDSSYFIVQ